MNPDDLGTALTEMAERWETPVFDPETLEQDSQARTRRHRYRLLAAAAVVVIAASGAITTTILIRSGDSTTNAPDTSSRPAIPPPVRVTALDTTGKRIDGVAVMASVPTGHPATVHARLTFLGNRPAAVKDAALVVAKPGTSGGVGGADVDSYYTDHHLEIVRGGFVTATSPEQRILTVTTPGDLPPGQYPVFSVYQSVLMPGQQPGMEGPFTVSGQVGVIVITAS